MAHSIGFNPRTREGCDKVEGDVRHHTDVSIHAPVKGATRAVPALVSTHVVSIHAPVKGATVSAAYFYILNSVSIHAPVKGATKELRQTSCNS